MRKALIPLLLGALVAFAQQPPTFMQTYEVRVSSVDVVVTDRQGQPVRGLQKTDFEVLENGVPQPITNFAAYDTIRSTAATGAPSSGTPAANATAAAPPPKRIVFFVDELSLHPHTRGKLLDNALRVIDTMQGDDQASVVTSTRTDRTVLEFTSNREVVRKALKTALDQGGFRTTRRDYERMIFRNQVQGIPDRREYDAAAHRYATLVYQRVNATLTALRALVAAIAPESGKKMIVVISSSLSAEPGREAFGAEDLASTLRSANDDFGDVAATVNNSGEQLWYDLRPALNELAAFSSGAGVTLYALQPDIDTQLQPGGDNIEHVGRAAITASSTVLPYFQQVVIDDTHKTLVTLADATGGKYAIGDRQFESAFQQITNDLQSYYSIGYRPSETRENVVRQVEVRVKGRPDLLVRAHTAVVREGRKREMNDLVASTLLYPRNVDELHITAEAAKPVSQGKTAKVQVSVHVPIANLTFIPDGDRYRAAFTVHFAVAGEDATFATAANREQVLQTSAVDLEHARTRTFTEDTNLVVSRGTTRIAIGVQDSVSHLTSFKTLIVNVR